MGNVQPGGRAILFKRRPHRICVVILSAFAEYHKHVEDPAVVKAGPVDECQKARGGLLGCDVTPLMRRITTASCLGGAWRAQSEAEGARPPQ